MAVKINHGRALAMLSLTSLMDVVFLLLIFFLVATRFAEEDESALDVQLPSASDAKPLTVRPKEVIVSIDERGRFFINGAEMTIEQVEQHLRRAMIDNPLGQSVIVRADKRVDLQSAVFIFNVCNKVGVSYKITTDAAASPAS